MNETNPKRTIFDQYNFICMFDYFHIHPMVVHFPIALLLLGFVFELIFHFFRKEEIFETGSFWLLIAGALSAFAAYFSGAFLTMEQRGIAGAVQNTHELFAEITVGSALICTAFKIYIKSEGKSNKILNHIGFVLYAIAAIAVSVTGYYGGVLVYDYLIPK